MTQGAIFTLGMLIEKEKAWVRVIDRKNDGKFLKVLRSWKSKQALPIYHDMKLTEVIKDMWDIDIARSTLDSWLKNIPELLKDPEELDNILEKKDENIRIVKDKEKKYTEEEWIYLHKIKGEALLNEQRALLTKLANPNLSDRELARLSGVSTNVINKINNFQIKMSNKDLQTKLINTTGVILELGLDKISSEIAKVEILKAQDLKAVSGVVSDVFNMNRLLKGESTSNVDIGSTLMARIHAKTEEKLKLEQEKKQADIIISKKS